MCRFQHFMAVIKVFINFLIKLFRVTFRSTTYFNFEMILQMKFKQKKNKFIRIGQYIHIYMLTCEQNSVGCHLFQSVFSSKNKLQNFL